MYFVCVEAFFNRSNVPLSDNLQSGNLKYNQNNSNLPPIIHNNFGNYDSFNSDEERINNTSKSKIIPVVPLANDSIEFASDGDMWLRYT